MRGGSARCCLGEAGGDYEVHGHVARAGNVTDLRFRPVVDDPVWLLHEMSSRRAGETLILNGTASYDPAKQHIVRSGAPEPPNAIVLRPGPASGDCPAP